MSGTISGPLCPECREPRLSRDIESDQFWCPACRMTFSGRVVMAAQPPDMPMRALAMALCEALANRGRASEEGSR